LWDYLVVWCKFADLSFSKEVSSFFPHYAAVFRKRDASRSSDRSEKRKTYKFHSISSGVLLNSCHVPFANVVNEQQVQSSKAFRVPGLFMSLVCVHVLPTA